MQPLLRWVHISDVHMGHGGADRRWDQRLVLDELRRDIVRQLQAQPEPPLDAILVTGDIANTGAGKRPDEYTEAAAWLTQVGKEAGVGPDRIFVVPGNHDVDRSTDRDPAVAQLVAELRSGARSLDEALAHPGDRALLARRQEKYLAFARAFATAIAGDRLLWTHRFVARSNLRVRLAGLNTALLAAGDDDQGKLRVGMTQIGEALEGTEDGELVLVLAHHPLREGWLADQAEIEPYLSRRAHALLTGHVHVADAEESRGGSGRTLLRIVAGSAHGDAMPPGIPAGHGYSFGMVTRDAQGKAAIAVFPRKWSAKNAGFRADVDNTPPDRAFSEHPLPSLVIQADVAPVAARAKASPAAVGVVRDQPVPVFISSAPEDDALRVALLKHMTTMRRQKRAVFKHSQEAIGDRREWIRNEMDRSRIILLLISKDYIAADDYYEDELLHAIERHEQGQARVIPVQLRRFLFHGEPFYWLQKWPRDGAPVDEHPKGTDTALMQIAFEVSRVVAEMRGEEEPPEPR